MTNTLPLNEAQSCVLQHALPLGIEQIDLLQSLGRVLAQDVRSNRDHPPCDISAMDGYAVRAADLSAVPAQLIVVADIKAGDLPTLTVQAGQCARIMTGAPIPQGADTVIRVEDTQVVDDGFPHPNRTQEPQAEHGVCRVRSVHHGAQAHPTSELCRSGFNPTSPDITEQGRVAPQEFLHPLGETRLTKSVHKAHSGRVGCGDEGTASLVIDAVRALTTSYDSLLAVQPEDGAKISDRVQINVSAKAGKDIRHRAENLRNNEVVLTAGTEINPGVLGVLAMVKAAEVTVQRRPRVAILSSGDELEGLHDAFDANKIPDANSYALMAQVQALGIQPTLLGIARDTPDDLREKLQQGLHYDVLLISGGTSVGVHDFVRPTLEQLGVRMHFWRVQMRPGHPVAFGTTATSKVFCLPGNPVSGMVCFEQLVASALRNMMGYSRLFRRTLPVRLAQAVAHRPGHVEFVRVVLSRDADGYLATPTGSQSSGVLLSMARADALLIVPGNSKGLAVGDQAMVQLLNGTEFEEGNESIL